MANSAKTSVPSVAHPQATFFAPIQREFDRLFDQLGSGWPGFGALDVNPRLDVRDTKDGLEITAEVPGMARDDVKITVEGDVLTIRGEKKSESEKSEGDYRVSERAYGAFSRSVSLPATVDAEKLTASMKDGVLKLVAPKNGKAQAKTIAIKSAD
jgi:HSP20 family protein